MSKKINPYVTAAVIGKRLEDFKLDGPLPESKYNELKELFPQLSALYMEAMGAGRAPKKFEDLDNKVWD